MKEITLLHIGDIHYEKIEGERGSVDLKDSRFPSNLTPYLASGNRKLVNRNLTKEINEDPSAILISGDLSTYGEIEGYKECLNYLESCIPSSYIRSENQKLFIVPGNHDIDRKSFCEDFINSKFQKINKVLEERSFPRIPYPEVTIKEIPKSVKGNILIISLNSCIGCGERRYFPPKIRELIKTFVEEMDNFPPNVQEIIKSFLNKDEGKDDKELMKLLYEDIDTPLINEDDIEKIIEYINSTDINTCLPIILTHHNLLPQKAPRVAMYTELINSGYFRDKLLKLNRPILYLHGHIHDDPIEIVQSSRYVNSKIICISAPLLYPAKNTEEKAGFNKIKIIYDHKEMPLGCEIINYRISSSNVEKKIEKIRFWDIFETQNFADEKDKAILKSIDDKLIHLIDLEEKVETEEGLYLSIDEIEKGLLRLSWLGLVRYNPQENDVRSSRFVQKVIP